MEYQIEAMGARRWARGCEVLAALFLWLAAMTLPAADLTRSVTFTDGQRLTAAQLHSLIDGASINVAFLTGKSLLGTVDSADYVLIYDTSAGTFKKMTLATLIMANTDLITTQSEEYNPAANDYLLLYDTSGTQLAKVSVTNLITGNTNLILSQLPITNLLSTAQFLVSNGGTNNRIRLDHLWANNFEYTRPLTNQLQQTSPTNQDGFLLWDAVVGTNKWTTLAAIFTNRPAITTNEPGGFIYTETNGVPSKITQSNFINGLGLPRKFASTNLPIAQISAAGKYFDTPHGLPGTPQAFTVVAECTTADLNYSIGDQVVLNGAMYNNAHVIPFVNATNVGFITDFAYSSWQIPNKTTFSGASPTSGRWVVKIVAEYFP